MTEGAGSSPSPVVPLRASWRRGPRSTTILLVRPLPLRVETGSGHVLLFSGGCALLCPLPGPLPHPPAQLSFGRARPPEPREVAPPPPPPDPASQPEALLPPSGKTEEDTAPTRGNQFRDSNYHKK